MGSGSSGVDIIEQYRQVSHNEIDTIENPINMGDSQFSGK